MPSASAKNMLPSLLALLFAISLFRIHGTGGVANSVNVLLHDATSTLHPVRLSSLDSLLPNFNRPLPTAGTETIAADLVFPLIRHPCRGPVHSVFCLQFVCGEKGFIFTLVLYKNKNKRADQLDCDWEYQGVLHEDKRDGLRMCECPMLIAMGDPLNTEWVLSYLSDKGSYSMLGKDAEGRERMNALFVGHFDGTKFEHRFEQKMDFAGGSFAYQSFYDQQSGRLVLIGWIHTIGWIGDNTGDPNFDGHDGVTSLTLAKAELVFEFNWDNGREEAFELHLTPTQTNGKQ
uniref:Glycosyl hydrolase family 32 N-terminal domain-containing protein n=1 Tax=Globodera rostochiensis TaxID=31243 RepID=A0A914H9P3_GLORO